MNENLSQKEIEESLSPIEKKIIPYLDKNVEEIVALSQLDETTVIRALNLLDAKKIIKLSKTKKQFVNLGTNGIYYSKNHLPERKLLSLLEKNNYLKIEEAKKLAGLTDNEFKVSLGILKDKVIIEIKAGKISVLAKKEEIIRKMPEEHLIEKLPKEISSLTDEENFALNNLKKRKDIVEINEKSELNFELTELGKRISSKKFTEEFLEEVTPELIKNFKRGKKFRKYDVNLPVSKIYGGKRHFVNQAIDYARNIWVEMGFKEMTGNKVVTSFWNFDSLFTAQDHPVREMQDTFFIENKEGKLPKKEFVQKISQAHEKGVDGSLGWKYNWNEEESKTVLLRTHTTSISAKTLAQIKKTDLPQKYFAVGKCFRNETVDWSHGFEFNQTEGIVIDKNANFRHLLGYLKEFFARMGYKKIRFTPSYFPYTEPSVEIHSYNEERKSWVELGGAGIFRPEVVVPIFGEYVPVLAWGPGFDRIIMSYYEIKDLREMYENDLAKLRKMKPWLK